MGGSDDYHAGLVWTRNDWVSTCATRVAILYHGATANEQQPFSNSTGMRKLLDGFLDAGYVVVSLRLGTTGVTDYTQLFPAWVSGQTYNTGDVVSYQLGLYKLKAGPYSNTKTPPQDPSHWQADNNDGKWGNLAMREAMTDIAGWLLARITIPDRGFCIVGFSAGGTNSLNCVIQMHADGVKVAGVTLIDPAVSLRDEYNPVPGNSTANIRSQLIAAYQLGPHDPDHDPTNGSGQNAHVGDFQWNNHVDRIANGGTYPNPAPSHDPLIVDLSALPSDCPFYVSYSDADTTIADELNAIPFVNRLNVVPWAVEVTTRLDTKNHGDDSHFQPTPTLAFFERALAL